MNSSLSAQGSSASKWFLKKVRRSSQEKHNYITRLIVHHVRWAVQGNEHNQECFHKLSTGTPVSAGKLKLRETCQTGFLIHIVKFKLLSKPFCIILVKKQYIYAV